MARLRPAAVLLALVWGVGLGQVVLPPGSRPIASPKDPCVEVKNLDTSMVELPRHKYMVLEHCLYYDIQNRNDRRFKQPNSLVVLPPNEGDGAEQTNITVSVLDIVIQHAWLNDMMKDLHIRGFMKLTWRDRRLSWEAREWKGRSELRLQTPSHLWLPSLLTASGRAGVGGMGQGDSLTFRRLSARNPGNVSAFLNFNLQSSCQVDLHNFPDDVHRCCFELSPKLYEDLTVLRVRTGEARLDPKFYRSTGWELGSDGVEGFWDEEGFSTLRFCLTMRRASSTLRLELSLPMAICAVLVAIAPLFGPLDVQLKVKLFALLLQYLCLQYLANKSSYIGMAGQTPRVFRFYEFTIAVNLLSILVSLLISLLARKERKLPPGFKLAQFAALFNGLFCCLDSAEAAEAAAGPEAGVPATPHQRSYKADWQVVFSAAHAALSLAVGVVYAFGLLVILL